MKVISKTSEKIVSTVYDEINVLKKLDHPNIVKVYENTKTKEETRAVDGVNLDIKKGEFVALLGPSGCGKTTTLMMIAGLLKPTKGEIYFGDKLVNHVEPRERNIGMVFQSYAIYPHLNVKDNIAFPLRERGMGKKEAYEKVKSMAKILQIEQLLERKPSQLSGGQQQRVAIARALVKNPDILLLDEPMSNLDARLKLDVRDELRQLQRRVGVTTVIVTHDQEEAQAISDRVAVLDKGKIQQFDTPFNLYHSPKNYFVANFLGNPPMNFIDGVITEVQGKKIFEAEGIMQPLKEGIPDAYIGKSIRLGVRPHDVKVVEYSQNEMKIDLVEYLGHNILVKAVSNGSSTTLRFTQEENSCFTVGATCYLEFVVDKILLFDMNQEGIRIDCL
jgi:inositol-phosphate transport system ATP-binding protein